MSLNSTLLAHVITEAKTTIEQIHPSSLVYCTDESIPALEALGEGNCEVAHVHGFDELESLPRFELGVVFDYLEHRPLSQGTQLLGRLRNLKCEKLWVAVSNSGEWNLNTMIALGFKRKNCYCDGEEEICTYSYDIATYNHKREWNNPKFWANPENWGKYRW